MQVIDEGQDFDDKEIEKLYDIALLQEGALADQIHGPFQQISGPLDPDIGSDNRKEKTWILTVL